MHTPTYYKVDDMEIIDQFIRENSFGTLITVGDIYPIATHIPLELEINQDGQQVLWGHISKANEQWKSFATHPSVLVTFLSPIHSYISSSWYNHPNVPTWNYMSVQISGTIKLIEGDAMQESLRRLIDKYEKDSKDPIAFDTLSPQVLKQMMGIVAFEISIDKKEASFKLSQNRNDQDFENIMNELTASGNPISMKMAELMKKYRQA